MANLGNDGDDELLSSSFGYSKRLDHYDRSWRLFLLHSSSFVKGWQGLGIQVQKLGKAMALNIPRDKSGFEKLTWDDFRELSKGLN